MSTDTTPEKPTAESKGRGGGGGNAWTRYLADEWKRESVPARSSSRRQPRIPSGFYQPEFQDQLESYQNLNENFGNAAFARSNAIGGFPGPYAATIASMPKFTRADVDACLARTKRARGGMLSCAGKRSHISIPLVNRYFGPFYALYEGNIEAALNAAIDFASSAQESEEGRAYLAEHLSYPARQGRPQARSGADYQALSRLLSQYGIGPGSLPATARSPRPTRPQGI
jgi:hypothetical protein